MSKNSITRRRQLVGVLSAVVLVVFMSLVAWFIGRPMLRLFSSPAQFRDWVDAKGIAGRLIFIGMVALQVVFAVIPGEPMEIGAGYAFGAWEGTTLCIIGGLLGSAVVFAFVRVFGQRLVELFYPVEKLNEMRFLKDTRRMEITAFIVFAIPGTPKDLLVYFFGLTKMQWFHFLLITSFGRLPSVITSTIGGNALGSRKYLLAIVVFAATVVVSVAGFFVYQKIFSKKR